MLTGSPFTRSANEWSSCPSCVGSGRAVSSRGRSSESTTRPVGCLPSLRNLRLLPSTMHQGSSPSQCLNHSLYCFHLVIQQGCVVVHCLSGRSRHVRTKERSTSRTRTYLQLRVFILQESTLALKYATLVSSKRTVRSLDIRLPCQPLFLTARCARPGSLKDPSFSQRANW